MKTDEKDPLFEEAKRVVQLHPKGYAGTLQGYLNIGYNRAAQLLEELERTGVISKNHKTGGYSLNRPGLFKRIVKFAFPIIGTLLLAVLGFALLVAFMFIAIIVFGGPA